MKIHLNRLISVAPILAAMLLCSCSEKQVRNTPAPSNGSEAIAPPFPKQAYAEISMKAQGRRIPVLMYHDVLPKDARKTVYFDVTADEFEDQMKWITDQGITAISLDQLYNHLTKGADVPEKSIVLTFDDNYQGFYDNALPILEKYHYPAAMFVHTKYVGDKTGKHPKMDWPTLKKLIQDPLITIGSHTVTHPDDITKLPPDEQVKELKDSKATLEKELGKPMPYLAYPDGKNDKVVQDNARDAGYTMAFTMVNTPAEESPNILAVGRYIQSKAEKAWDDRDRDVRGGGFDTFNGPIHDSMVTYKQGTWAGAKLSLVIGGKPESLMSATREGVLDFIHRTPGSVAGINGGFFLMAAIQSTDNRMVGPCKIHDSDTMVPDLDPERWVKLRNRPVLLWGPTSFGIASFEPETGNSDEAFKDFMPDYTDAFLAGAWLVHKGVGRKQEDMGIFASKDIKDPRRRAFIGIDWQGRIVLGAATDSVSSEKLAEAAALAGVQEAVLLDSGFSTSLVYGDDVKASGHSTETIPSRPVPHAIVLMGQLDPATAALGVSTFKPGPQPDEQPRPRRRRRRRRAENPDDVAVPKPDDASAPPIDPDKPPPGNQNRN